ncbi:hypothetical protein CEE37_12370 [candidate division LCP-89 bacterium B3_LCP]|uniref:PD-(D/E)XK endonuclease-like domain-containing protein n=1 Tax=candidate division LCP-89 bacterium B3_LCP TaxID=2012998 RepID=A0A532UUD0_UNCL8|nr:MAG: hypothetical protein CEE37_12370 [candidate division LCP-89 bacterium B3_LCP]
MTDLANQIEFITPESEKNLWDMTCRVVAELSGGDVWNLPFWIACDTRHKAAAELSLLKAVKQQAIPTQKIHTLLSFACDILGIGLFETVVNNHTAGIAIGEILHYTKLATYTQSQNTPGFISSFWNATQEAESNGIFPDGVVEGIRTDLPPQEFRELHSLLHKNLTVKGQLTPGEILHRAIYALRQDNSAVDADMPVVIGPLSNPTKLEKAFIHNLAYCFMRVIVIPGRDSTWIEISDKNQLEVKGQEEKNTVYSFTQPTTPEAELDATFGFIAEAVAAGRYRYGDFRIYHPFLNDEYPRVAATARRYRVPLKDAFSQGLDRSTSAISLLKIISLFDNCWDRVGILQILRTGILKAPVAEITELVMVILRYGQPPKTESAAYWIQLAEDNNCPAIAEELRELLKIDLESGKKASGEEFSDCLIQCTGFIKGREKVWQKLSFEDVQAKKEIERSWQVLEALIDSFKAAFKKSIPRGQLVKAFKRSLQMCRYSPGDNRTDAVELCPGTREDHLPVSVALYLSLDSRVPASKRSSAFLQTPDSDDYLGQFRHFSELLANAQYEVHLSCPKFSDDGDKLVKSTLLKTFSSRAGITLKDKGTPEIWYPSGNISVTQRKVDQNTTNWKIREKEALTFLQTQNLRWSPTQLDNAIQCSYLHFARDVMTLSPRDDQIRTGVTAMILGSIAHAALEAYLREARSGVSFDLEKYTRDEFHRRSGRFKPHLEADRDLEELIDNLNSFVERGLIELLPDFKPAEPEWKFGGETALKLHLEVGEVVLEGKIDRLDLSGDHLAVITEYKYRSVSGESKGDFFEGLKAGLLPQLPLYALATKELLKKKPAMLLQIYLRSGIIRGIKLKDLPDPPDYRYGKNEVEISSIDEAIEKSVATLEKAAMEISSGKIPARPRNYNNCGPGRCDFSDLCRYR